MRSVFLARERVSFGHSVLLFYWDRLSDLGGTMLIAGVSAVCLATDHRMLLPIALMIMVGLWFIIAAAVDQPLSPAAAALLPAGAGLVETTSIGLLTLQGLPLPDAVAVGLIHRALTFWFAIALGSGCLASLIKFRRHA